MIDDSKRAFKRELFAQFARVGKALGNGARIELLDLLAQAERTVEELADLTESPVANVSQHLQVLRQARLVEVRREGLYAHYRLADERVFGVWQAVRELGEARLAEIESVVKAYLTERDALEAVTAKELSRRLSKGSAVVIDVRPAAEYRAGHIPGARSYPVGELHGRLKELPRGLEIVAYCRGPYCVQSYEAVALLRRRGFKARRLEVGLPDWRAKGLRVETGAGSAALSSRRARPATKKSGLQRRGT
ncbi:MAG: metalloregulator ArsR/SmtB family transcription factor [Verrucomicrobiota bacterium]